MPVKGMNITFWGTRGSLPVMHEKVLKYGGNTSCVQVEIGENLIILDAGTGIYQLGQQLLKKGEKITGHIFLSHYHWDHIHGLPFFAPLFREANSFTIYGEGKKNLDIKQIMEGQMSYPYFPLSWHDLKADIIFRQIKAGDIICLENGITVKTASNCHPDGAVSYRIDYKGASCCYLLDTEHDPAFLTMQKEMAKEADVLIYDASFTDEEYQGLTDGKSRKGWGHSTWQEGIKLAVEAKAKMLVLFHHAVERTDEELAAIETRAQKQFPSTIAAREGMVIKL